MSSREIGCSNRCSNKHFQNSLKTWPETDARLSKAKDGFRVIPIRLMKTFLNMASKRSTPFSMIPPSHYSYNAKRAASRSPKKWSKQQQRMNHLDPKLWRLSLWCRGDIREFWGLSYFFVALCTGRASFERLQSCFMLPIKRDIVLELWLKVCSIFAICKRIRNSKPLK